MAAAPSIDHFAGSHAQFVGVLGREDRTAGLRDILSQVVGGNSGHIVYNGAQVLLGVLGRDAWQGPNLARDEDGLQLILGEPLYTPASSQRARTDLLRALKDPAPDALARSLRDCHGSFAGLRIRGAHVDLFSDKLGLRPVYLYTGAGGVFVYSSSRTLLVQIVRAAGLATTPDDRGIAEWIAWSYSLADRTPWREVRRLREATVARLDAESGEWRESYHTWGAPTDPTLDLPSAARLVFEKFQLAVRCRHDAMPTRARQLAFLSGGMDSRFVVASLMSQLGQPPVTMNIAPPGSLDAHLGNLAAQTLGTEHRYVPAQDGWAPAMDRATAACQAELGLPEPSLWWSGDGGSVGLGHVYLSEDMCHTGTDAPREADLARRILEFNRRRVLGRSLAPSCRDMIDMPRRGVEEELRRLQHMPAQRRAFAFFLFNDQQRHLDAHYDRLHERAFDLILPFFDARLLEAVMQIPVAHMLRHKLYNLIFAEHPMGSMAWQPYPGHEPCPHPLPADLRQQWRDGWYTAEQRAAMRRRDAVQALRCLIGAPPQLDRLNVLAAALATWTGLRDLSYVLTEAQRVCAGFHRDGVMP